MKKLIFILSICLLIPSNSFAQQSFIAKVVGMVDGDTITIYTSDKRQLVIRFAGIDAPELEQDFGASAKEQLAGLIFDKDVTVADLKKDCFERLSASVSFKEKNLNLLLVEAGNAWADNSCQNNEAFSKAELSAREKKSGLWQYPNPVRPDEFLQAKQSAKKDRTFQTKERKIFAGLAPAPPPLPPGIYIGMSFDALVAKCGKEAKAGKVLTTGSGKSFSVDYPYTEENKAKGCFGNFSFSSAGNNGILRLSSAYQ